MYLTHSKTKKIETWESGAEKVLLQRFWKDSGQFMLKKLKFQMVFGKAFLWAKSRGRPAKGVTLLSLVGCEITEWYSQNLNHRPSGSSQSGVHVLVFCLKLPSSSWLGSLVPIDRLRNMCQIVTSTPSPHQEESGPCFIAALLFIDYFAFASAFLHSLFYFIFYWRIIALRNFSVFCQTSTSISHKYTHIPSFLNLPPNSFPIYPTRLIQSPRLSLLSHTANSHWLSIVHVSIYM